MLNSFISNKVLNRGTLIKAFSNWSVNEVKINIPANNGHIAGI